MDVKKAYEVMFEGKKVRRESWGNPNFYIEMCDDVVVDSDDENYFLTFKDIESDDWVIYEDYTEAAGLVEFFQKVDELTKKQLDTGDDHNIFYLYMMEEVGEVSTALAVEKGKKQRELTETSQQEMVDVIINALGMYISLGGTIKHLVEYGKKKNAKWEKKLEKLEKTNGEQLTMKFD